jgi:hypothetical protein
MKTTMFIVVILVLAFGRGTATARSPFLPEKGGGIIGFTFAYSNWDKFNVSSSTRSMHLEHGDANDYAYLIDLDYGLLDNLALDLRTGYVKSKMDHDDSPIHTNDGIADIEFGIRVSLLSPFGSDEGLTREAPFFLSFRLGGQIGGTYERTWHSRGKGQSRPVLNMPDRGDDTIDIGLYPGWVSLSGILAVAGEVSYAFGVGDSLDNFVLGLTVSEQVLPRLSLFQILRREKATKGYSGAKEMMAKGMQRGVMRAYRLEEAFYLWNLGFTVALTRGYCVSIYGGAKFGHRRNTSFNKMANISLFRTF